MSAWRRCNSKPCLQSTGALPLFRSLGEAECSAGIQDASKTVREKEAFQEVNKSHRDWDVDPTVWHSLIAHWTPSRKSSRPSLTEQEAINPMLKTLPAGASRVARPRWNTLSKASLKRRCGFLTTPQVKSILFKKVPSMVLGELPPPLPTRVWEVRGNG